MGCASAALTIIVESRLSRDSLGNARLAKDGCHVRAPRAGIKGDIDGSNSPAKWHPSHKTTLNSCSVITRQKCGSDSRAETIVGCQNPGALRCRQWEPCHFEGGRITRACKLNTGLVDAAADHVFDSKPTNLIPTVYPGHRPGL